MKRFPCSGIAFGAAWHLLTCGVFLLSGVALHAQQTPDAIPPPVTGGNRISLLIPAETTTPPSDAASTRLTLDARFNIYAHGLISPTSLIGPAIGAGFGQWNNSPPEWRRNLPGYGQRLASGYGRSVISATISFGVAAMDHEDPRFMPSHARGFLRRASHAIAGTFVTRTDRGDRIPAYSRFAGHYSAAFVSNSWYPERSATVGGAMERGSTALLSSVVWSLLQEFGPDIRKVFHRQRN